MARRLSRYLQDKGISGTFRNRRQDFSVSRDWVRFARILDISSDSYRIQWNHAAVRDLQLDKDVLARGFTDSIDPQGQLSWG